MRPPDPPSPPAAVTWTGLPVSVPVLDPPSEQIADPEALAHATPADDAPFTLSGRRARITVDGLHGIREVEGDGVLLARDVGVSGLTGANLLVGPRSARREGFLAGIQVMEAVVVPELLPGVAVQWWRPSGGSGGPVELRARLPLPDAPGELRGHARTDLLWLARGGAGVLLSVPHLGSSGHESPETGAGDPRPHGLEILEVEGEIEVRWTVDLPRDPALPCTLLVQAAPPGGRWTHLRPLAGVTAHHRRGEAAAVGHQEPGIVLRTGVDAMDRGVAWARSWIRHDLRTVPLRDPDLHRGPAHRVTRTAAAAGEWETARAGAGAVAAELLGGTAADPLAAGAALAAWLLWSGEKEPLTAAAEALRAALPGVAGVDDSHRERLRRIHSAAEGAELDALLAAVTPLKEAADAAWRAGGRPGARKTGGGLRLPVAGRRGQDPAGEGDGTGPGADAVGPDPGGSVRERLAAALRFRESAEEVVNDPSGLDAATADRVLRGLVEDLLGARPDAAFGRLSLAPLLPPTWTRFEVLGLRAGEGTLDLRWEKSEGEASWQVTPQLGSVPIMVILEPVVPFSRVDEVRVDGQPTDLEAEPVNGWSRLQFQIPADGQRTVTVRGVPTPVTPP